MAVVLSLKPGMLVNPSELPVETSLQDALWEPDSATYQITLNKGSMARLINLQWPRPKMTLPSLPTGPARTPTKWSFSGDNVSSA